MTLSFDTVTSHIRHTLGGDVASTTDMYRIVNDAGDYMASMHPWRWLEDVKDDVNSTSALPYILLPAGFVELIGFAPRGLDSRNSVLAAAAAGRFYAVSMQEINDKRESSGDADMTAPTTGGSYAKVPAATFYFAIAYTNTGSASPTPRIELFPTPKDSTGSASSHEAVDCKMTIWYRRAWAQVTTPSSVFSLPQWMEPLYLQCVRAFTRGYEEEDLATANARLAEVVAGPLFMVAIQRDSLVESTTLRVVRRDTPVSLAGPFSPQTTQA